MNERAGDDGVLQRHDPTALDASAITGQGAMMSAKKSCHFKKAKVAMTVSQTALASGCDFGYVRSRCDGLTSRM